jgi:hypothetical protein
MNANDSRARRIDEMVDLLQKWKNEGASVAEVMNAVLTPLLARVYVWTNGSEEAMEEMMPILRSTWKTIHGLYQGKES